MTRPSRVVLALLLVLALVLSVASSSCSSAPAFPNKAIEVTVAFPAGSSSDVMMRALADAASKEFGQPVVVVNKGGGNGIIGTGEVARAKADGYSILQMQAGPGATQPHIENVPYKMEDFEPILQHYGNPLFLVAGADTPWKTAKEFAEDAKKNPGKINFGAGPVGGVPHLTMEFFANVGGFKVTVVPFQAAAPALTALLGGHIQVTNAHPADVVAQLETGKIKLLGVYEPERLKAFPDVPTMKEQGFDAVGYVWGGLVVPKGTPKDVQTKLHDGFKKALESQQVKESWGKIRMSPTYLPAAEFLKLWKTDYEKYGQLIANLKKAGAL
ncbi:MAG: tripartite tricarboxylate transporter substrate binding protein [Chloroflexota bacterium]